MRTEPRTVDGGGMRIAYRRAGAGPPLLLLHGGLVDGREWRPQFDGLRDAFDLVAWDAPGCGGSDDAPEGWRLSDWAASLVDFMDAVGLERPHVMGLSWGSGLALELYRQRPGRVRSLVLTAAYAGWAGSLPPEVVAERVEGALRDAGRPVAEVVADWMPGLLTPGATPEMVDEVASVMLELRPGTMRTMLLAFAEADLRDVLPTIAVPTLLLYGELDRRSPLTVARSLHAGIPGSELVVIDGAGHCANLEAADRFNAEVRRFLGTPAA